MQIHLYGESTYTSEFRWVLLMSEAEKNNKNTQSNVIIGINDHANDGTVGIVADRLVGPLCVAGSIPSLNKYLYSLLLIPGLAFICVN